MRMLSERELRGQALPHCRGRVPQVPAMAHPLYIQTIDPIYTRAQAPAHPAGLPKSAGPRERSFFCEEIQTHGADESVGLFAAARSSSEVDLNEWPTRRGGRCPPAPLKCPASFRSHCAADTSPTASAVQEPISPGLVQPPPRARKPRRCGWPIGLDPGCF